MEKSKRGNGKRENADITEAADFFKYVLKNEENSLKRFL